MEPVEQESHELLGIVLGVACKLAGFAGHNCLSKNTRQTKGNPHHVLHAALVKNMFVLRGCSRTLSFDGWKAWWVPFQRALSSTAKPMASLPPVPSGLLQLISASNARSAQNTCINTQKQSEMPSSYLLLRHSQHCLPRFGMQPERK